MRTSDLCITFILAFALLSFQEAHSVKVGDKLRAAQIEVKTLAQSSLQDMDNNNNSTNTNTGNGGNSTTASNGTDSDDDSNKH